MKLVKRDEELEEIQDLLDDFKGDLDSICRELVEHNDKKLEEKEKGDSNGEIAY
jgi:hypothetical protein